MSYFCLWRDGHGGAAGGRVGVKGMCDRSVCVQWVCVCAMGLWVCKGSVGMQQVCAGVQWVYGCAACLCICVMSLCVCDGLGCVMGLRLCNRGVCV